MPTDRVTKRSVDSLKPASIDVILWDDSLAGFGVKVTPSGHKSYVVQYRPGAGGRRSTAKRIVLGTHGALTPDEARKLAKRELGRVAQGQDPAEERAKQKGEKKVRELGVEYLEEVQARRKPGTYAEYKRSGTSTCCPRLAGRALRRWTCRRFASFTAT